MNSNTRPLTRRRFVENSAIALGLFGPVAAASSYGTEQPNLPSTITGNQVNARHLGARGDGSTDDTKAVQAALEDARTNGPVCYLPPGLYRLNGPLTVPAGVTLCGASGGVPHSEHPIGTVFLAYGGKGLPEGEPLITLKPNAIVRSLIIHYPEQTLPEVVAGKRAITLEKGLKAATVLGCTLRGVNAIDDQSGGDVKIGLNTNS